MAEGLLRHIADDKFDIESAGISPSHVRPEAIAVMQELGVDITSHRSKSVDEFTSQAFDYIITVCDNARETCPVFPGGATRLHWSFSDPAAVGGTDADKLAAFRQVRDQIRGRLTAFAKDPEVQKDDG